VKLRNKSSAVQIPGTIRREQGWTSGLASTVGVASVVMTKYFLNARGEEVEDFSLTVEALYSCDRMEPICTSSHASHLRLRI
jgi:predicted DNA-binding protein